MGRVRVLVAVTAVLLTAGVFGLSPSQAQAQGSFQDEIANLRSPNTGTRVKAAKALGKSGRLEAIPALTQSMRDPEVKVRRASVDALRAYTSSEAVDGLLVGLLDGDKSIRREALTSLLEVYAGAGNAELGGSSLSWITGGRKRTPGLNGLVPVDPRVVDGVAGRLQDEESSLRRRAAYTLGVLGAEAGVAPLSAALFDGDKGVQRETVMALGKIGSDAAGAALRSALGGAVNDVSGDVVDALGQMQYKPAATELVEIYDSNVNKLGDRALRSLALMGAPEARGIFYYQMTSKKAEQRLWAVEGLGRLEDSSMIPGLMKDFLREPEPSVQLAYCFALTNLGRHEFVDRIALDLGNKKRREQAHEYAVELGSPLLSEFVKYLSDPVPEVRKELAVVLMEIGDPEAIPHLQPLVGDTNSDVADRANRAIARLQQGRMTASATQQP